MPPPSPSSSADNRFRDAIAGLITLRAGRTSPPRPAAVAGVQWFIL